VAITSAGTVSLPARGQFLDAGHGVYRERIENEIRAGNSTLP
jgi:hypothetical protein